MLARQLLPPVRPRRLPAPPPGVVDLACSPPAPTGGSGRDGLDALVATAATIDLDDSDAVQRLRAAAHRVTAQLADTGGLARHLVVAPDDPGVVVVKTLAVAAKGSPAAGALPATRTAAPAEPSPAGASCSRDGRSATRGVRA